jgi:uncharacterized protein with FMN-binding domain
VVTARSRTRRNAAVFAGTGTVLGLLLLFPTSTNRQPATRRPGQPLAPAGIVGTAAGTLTASAPSPGAPDGTSTGRTPSAGPTAPAAPQASAPLVVNGSAVDTRYGLVQVQITVASGRVVQATALDYPQQGGRDREINRRAVPLLEQATLRAQSALVDTVSGATFTSEGYRRSLQAALDAAHLG